VGSMCRNPPFTEHPNGGLGAFTQVWP
jgi:hypothetical protein